MNEAPTAHYPKLIRTEYGFAVTDGLRSFPCESFAEGREVAKVAAAEGMDAAGEALYGPCDYEEYVDEDRLWAEYAERLSERGTWFGVDPDGWG